jgi:starch synthase
MGFAILGTGEKARERELESISEANPGTVGLALRYDDDMARKVFSGSDLLLMPSRFEPCGLAQMIGMRYGAVPLVRLTGGLADTVRDVGDGGCGFVFRRPDPAELWKTLKSALDLYNRRNRWAWLIKRNMLQDNSWRSRITLYEDVYRGAKAHRKAR